MSNQISLDNISLAYGLQPLLDHIKLQIATGERICLIGRNGEGKSSLLKIIEGSILPDSGNIWRKPGLRLARLSQELPNTTSSSVYEFVASGLADTGKLLTAYHTLTQQLSKSSSDEDLKKLEQLQQEIENVQGWQYEQMINTTLSHLKLTSDLQEDEGKDTKNLKTNVSELSGGWQRRAALAQVLVSSPDLLLLDEPTNHLDVTAIAWLENLLLNYQGAILFITHDRTLLKKIATRIIELDRGQLTSWPGDYDNFLRRKAEMLHAEAKENAEFDKKLAQEERWIRQGIKARRTRNEGRVRALQALRLERSKRRELQNKATFNLQDAEKSGQLVIVAQHITHRANEKLLINDFSLRVQRGDRIGLIGPNGVGKTTLLNILLKKIQPQAGTVTHGTKLEIAYFDQLRQQINPEKSVLDNVAQGSDTIEINGKKQHIISYLADFLFTPQRALTPAKALSGGECNRLVLARLFSKPSNLLVLDEPTNDLDIETLELLEEILSNYQGTLLLVSHDRAFLDNIVTSTLYFAGAGKVQEYIGGYQDLLRQIASNVVQTSAPKTTKKTDVASTQKLTSKEKKELAELTQTIEILEEEQTELQQQIANPEFYKQGSTIITKTNSRLHEIEVALFKAYQRWEELEK